MSGLSPESSDKTPSLERRFAEVEESDLKDRALRRVAKEKKLIVVAALGSTWMAISAALSGEPLIYTAALSAIALGTIYIVVGTYLGWISVEPFDPPPQSQPIDAEGPTVGLRSTARRQALALANAITQQPVLPSMAGPTGAIHLLAARFVSERATSTRLT